VYVCGDTEGLKIKAIQILELHDIKFVAHRQFFLLCFVESETASTFMETQMKVHPYLFSEQTLNLCLNICDVMKL